METESQRTGSVYEFFFPKGILKFFCTGNCIVMQEEAMSRLTRGAQPNVAEQEVAVI